MIRLEHVTVELGRTRVLQGVSAFVADGEWVALIGPNGAGKTTLLRAIAGLVPHGGTIEDDGCVVGAIGRRELARRVAVVPQTPSMPGELTVREYVLLGRTAYLPYLGSESRRDLEATERALARLDLGMLAERRLGSLSGGEQ